MAKQKVLKQKIKTLVNKLKLLAIGKKLRPVFIVGCGHSGTSIMLSLLDNHSKVYAVKMETKIFFRDKVYSISNILKWYKEAKRLNKSIIVEKTPSHIHRIDNIFSTVKNARIILMLRDGRDVACSIKERTGDFNKGINRWIEDNEIGYVYWNDERVMVVRLEDLTANSKDVLKDICDFIKIDFESEMITKQGSKPKLYYTDKIPDRYDFEGQEPSDFTHNARRNWQVNQGLFSDTSRWNKELNQEELSLFNQKAGHLLKLYGYNS